MYTLGINISHDASSCLCKNGEVVYYIEEERLSREKHHMYRKFNSSQFHGLIKLKYYRVKKIEHLIFSSYRRPYDYEDLSIINSIVEQIKRENIEVENVHYVRDQHHIYHAYNAFYNSPFSEAGVLICDGFGAYNDEHKDYREAESIYKMNEDNCQLLYKHSINGYYKNGLSVSYGVVNKPYEYILSNSISSAMLFYEYCGKFGMDYGNDAGKLMGASSYGTVTDDTKWYDKTEFGVIFNSYAIDKLNSMHQLDFEYMANMAKKLQEETKEYTIELIRKTIEKTECDKIVLSGGYFLNCVNNYKYIEEFPNIKFYIDPIAYDGGTAIGACRYIDKIKKPINNLYIGGAVG